ncbi:MAG: hypothetical protein C4539_17830, partial [Ignavibacteriales bacterium]
MNENFQNLGKLIVFAGIVLIIIGVILFFSAKIPFIGKLIHQDWYQIPKELDRPLWSEPYFD